MDSIPRLLITMGDVAGIGPEIIARAWPDLLTVCRPIVVGDPSWLVRSIRLVGSTARPQVIGHPEQADASRVVVPCIAGSSQDLSRVEPGKVDGAAGRAAYDFLCAAIDWTMAGAADGIVTAPLHKEGLRAAGLHYPGHTEILAERTGTKQYAMMLYINDIGAGAWRAGGRQPPGSWSGPRHTAHGFARRVPPSLNGSGPGKNSPAR